MKLARKNADRPTTRVGAALAATAGVGAAIATAGKQKQRAAVSVVIAVGGSCGHWRTGSSRWVLTQWSVLNCILQIDNDESTQLTRSAGSRPGRIESARWVPARAHAPAPHRHSR